MIPLLSGDDEGIFQEATTHRARFEALEALRVVVYASFKNTSFCFYLNPRIVGVQRPV
jgi:hypothetical protein